jgi:predicted RecA/RadA family phage recombinase
MVPKTTGAAWKQGEKLNFVVATGAFQVAGGAGTLPAGVAAAPAAAGDAFGEMILNGNGR